MKVLLAANINAIALQGWRTAAQQQADLAAGKSKTSRSRHLTGHAADLAAFDDHGALTWEFPGYVPLAAAIRKAAIQFNIQMDWGSVWDCHLNDLSDDLNAEMYAYKARMEAQGTSPFIDSGHFQLSWQAYPVS
jgi:peptidoglycan L-alanyl-D-glutamate endopeptidase CwlK